MEYEYFGRIGKDPQHADTLLPWGQVAKVSRMCLMGRTAGWLKVDDVEQTPDSIVFRLSVPQIGELGWCKIEKLLNGKTRVTFSGIPYQVLVGLSDDEVNKRLARLDAVIASYFYLVEQEFQEFAEFFPEETKEEAPAEIINKNDGPGNGAFKPRRNGRPWPWEYLEKGGEWDEHVRSIRLWCLEPVISGEYIASTVLFIGEGPFGNLRSKLRKLYKDADIPLRSPGRQRMRDEWVSINGWPKLTKTGEFVEETKLSAG